MRLIHHGKIKGMGTELRRIEREIVVEKKKTERTSQRKGSDIFLSQIHRNEIKCLMQVVHSHCTPRCEEIKEVETVAMSTFSSFYSKSFAS